MKTNNKKIVITGLGVIAPNGIGKEQFWQALKEGKSGIKRIRRFDTSEFKCKLARSEEHTSELQSHSFISYAVFCLKKKKKQNHALLECL